MSRLSEVSSNPMLKAFAQGAAQNSIMPIADFLAPTVPVSAMTGRYKVYTEKNRFRIPKTLRALGGRATELGFEATDSTYSCEPHSLDFPIDNLERLEASDLEDAMKEGATSVAEVAALSHEKTVIDLALASLGAGTAKIWGTTGDAVSDLDTAILDVIKAAGYGSLMGVGILFGANAFRLFKNSAAVKARFVTGAGPNKLSVANEEIVRDLLMSRPDVRTSFMVYDTAPEGKAASLDFVLDTDVLVFARKANPTRRDPSFMKTFRLVNKYMVPGSYMREDGRAEVAKFDWSEDVKVTNSGAARRYTITAS